VVKKEPERKRPAARAKGAKSSSAPKAARTARASARANTKGTTPPPPAELSTPVEANAHDDGAVIITGICGRMGQLLARKLHRKLPVIGIDRRRFEGKPEDIVHYQIDVRRRKTQDIFRSGNIRAVVHLGVMHNLRESDRTHHSWNVVGFQKLLEYVATYKVPKLVVLSSAMLYGPSPDNPHFMVEDAPLLGAQDFFQIRDLVEVDMLAQSFFWKHPEVETVILRPCHILGRVHNAASNYMRMERPITVLGFDPMLQVIHERDVVEAMLLALSPGARGIYNLRGPGELPLSHMLQLIGRKPIAVPGPLINSVLGRLWNYRATTFPKEELDHLRYICLVDDSRARKELGFAPRHGIEETLRAVNAEW
jgi:UDP-glucose 4-epimerase